MVGWLTVKRAKTADNKPCHASLAHSQEANKKCSTSISRHKARHILCIQGLHHVTKVVHGTPQNKRALPFALSFDKIIR